MAAISLALATSTAKPADYITADERARLEARRDMIERSDLGYTRHAAERRCLDAALSPIDCPLQADRLRVACGLPALNEQRQRFVEALASLPNHVPGATHGALTAESIGDLTISIGSTFNPSRFYAYERAAREAEHRAWSLVCLTDALAWLSRQVPLAVLSRDDDAEGGPVARVALCRTVDLQVAA